MQKKKKKLCQCIFLRGWGLHAVISKQTDQSSEADGNMQKNWNQI